MKWCVGWRSTHHRPSLGTPREVVDGVLRPSIQNAGALSGANPSIPRTKLDYVRWKTCKSQGYSGKSKLSCFLRAGESIDCAMGCIVSVEFPAIMCFSGSIVFCAASIMLRKLKVPDKPPASRSSLSLHERQENIRIASWLCLGLGLLMLAGAMLFEFVGFAF